MAAKIEMNNHFPFFNKITIFSGTKIYPWYIDLKDEEIKDSLKAKFNAYKKRFNTLLYFGFIEKRIKNENGWEIPEYYITQNFQCKFDDEIKEILGICGYTKFKK